jgi:hypothetical protein
MIMRRMLPLSLLCTLWTAPPTYAGPLDALKTPTVSADA